MTTENEIKAVSVEDVNPNTDEFYTEEEATAANLASGATALEAVVTTAKRPKKLSKSTEGTVITITVLGSDKGALVFDTALLPEAVQKELVPFGAGHKLGDSAAGREGQEAVDAIEKVWAGLVAGDWSVRAPAAAKVSLSSIKDALSNMSPEEQEQAKALMLQMGITI